MEENDSFEIMEEIKSVEIMEENNLPEIVKENLAQLEKWLIIQQDFIDKDTILYSLQERFFNIWYFYLINI